MRIPFASFALCISWLAPGAHAADYAARCDFIPQALDSALSSAIADAQQGTPATVLVQGTCFLQASFTMNAAGSLAIIGTTASSDINLGGSGRLLLVQPLTGDAKVTLRNLTISNAQDTAIAVDGGSLYVRDVFFNQNRGIFGGAIAATNASITIRRSRFAGNVADRGGAIATQGSAALDVEDSAFFGNSASDSGGAIWTSAPFSVRQSLLSGGSAANLGGGLYASGSGEVRNSTFDRSAATSGGAIAVDTTGALVLANATLSTNYYQAPFSALHSLSDTLAINNTLIGGSCSGFAAMPSGTGNIEPLTTSCRFGTGNQSGAAFGQILLGDQADNGGPTLSMLPATGSIMIDTGTAPCEAVDQRGFLRTAGACDVGAVEAGSTTPNVIFADSFDS